MGCTDCEDMIVNCADRRFDSISDLFRETAGRLSVPCRIQIGSYTCGNYFLELLNWMERGSSPVRGTDYDIVLPVFSESQLDEFLPRAETSPVQAARTIIVNDLGMLRLFRDRPGVRLGRLLFRDYRDHRYPASEDACRLKAGALVSSLRELGYQIAAIENELISANSEADGEPGVPVYVHFPYRQVSYGHICEFASIGRTVEEKFMPDAPCTFQCFRTRFRHREEYLKVGRSIFDMAPEQWLSGERRKRVIYTPRW